MLRRAASASLFELADLRVCQPEVISRNRVRRIGAVVEFQSLDLFIEFAGHDVVVMLQ